MKLKEFNAEDFPNTRTTAPAFSIDTKVGCNRLNREACELIGLKAGDKIKFLQDEEEEGDWYIEKVKEGGFVLRTTKNATSLCFNSTPMAKKIADSVVFEGRSGRCLIAGQPTELNKRKLFGILTNSLKN
jgi:hypothetical protein